MLLYKTTFVQSISFNCLMKITRVTIVIRHKTVHILKTKLHYLNLQSFKLIGTGGFNLKSCDSSLYILTMDNNFCFQNTINFFMNNNGRNIQINIYV